MAQLVYSAKKILSCRCMLSILRISKGETCLSGHAFYKVLSCCYSARTPQFKGHSQKSRRAVNATHAQIGQAIDSFFFFSLCRVVFMSLIAAHEGTTQYYFVIYFFLHVISNDSIDRLVKRYSMVWMAPKSFCVV